MLILSINGAKTDRINAPANPLQNPSILKPGDSFATSRNNKAFTTRLNNPIVRKFKGTEINSAIGRTNRLTSPITATTKAALKNPDTVIPGTIAAINIINNVSNIHLTAVFISDLRFQNNPDFMKI